jgi:hypothetical protein
MSNGDMYRFQNLIVALESALSEPLKTAESAPSGRFRGRPFSGLYITIWSLIPHGNRAAVGFVKGVFHAGCRVERGGGRNSEFCGGLSGRIIWKPAICCISSQSRAICYPFGSQ